MSSQVLAMMELTTMSSSSGLGLMFKYTDNVAFRIRVKCLAALAFLPVTNVIPAFKSLAITFLNVELPLLSYFETTWIGQPDGGRRLAPIFPHHMWNVLDRASTGSTRTTNSFEAFHHTFNALVSCQHPTVWPFILEKQISSYELLSLFDLSLKSILGKNNFKIG